MYIFMLRVIFQEERKYQTVKPRERPFGPQLEEFWPSKLMMIWFSLPLIGPVQITYESHNYLRAVGRIVVTECPWDCNFYDTEINF